MRTSVKVLIGLAAGLVLLGAGASWRAQLVYCVDVSGAGCDVTESPGGDIGLAAAVSAANMNVDADTIRVGDATYTAPLQAGYVATHPLSIVGTGQGAGHTVLSVLAPATEPASFTTFNRPHLPGRRRGLRSTRHAAAQNRAPATIRSITGSTRRRAASSARHRQGQRRRQ